MKNNSVNRPAAMSIEETFGYLTEDLERTWASTENLSVNENLLQLSAKDSLDLIKKESRTRILLTKSDASGRRLCLKLYRVPPHLCWRTTFLSSRAMREFDNLQAAKNSGLPVVPPIGWAEYRKKGMLHFSAVGTLYIPALSMQDAIAAIPVEDPRRIEIIRSSGKLLAQLHQAGLSWMTALPRNIMVVDKSDGELLALDIPYGHWVGRSIIGKREAVYDTHMMLENGLHKEKFSTLETQIFLDAYCNGDRSAQYKLQERLNSSSARSRWIYRISARSKATLKPVTNNCTRKISNSGIHRSGVATKEH